MTDWTPEEEEAFNDVEKHSNLGKQILRDRFNKSSGMDCCTYDCIQGRDCPVRKAKWVGLTEKDICEAAVKSQEGISPRDDTLRFAIAIEAKLKEKNNV